VSFFFITGQLTAEGETKRTLRTDKFIFILQRFIARHQHLETSNFCRIEKQPIFQPCQTRVGSRIGFMMAEKCPQIMRDIFIKQHVHGTG